jgi:hypothetical protein
VAFAQRSAGLFGPLLELNLGAPPVALVAEKATAAGKEFSAVTLSPPTVTTFGVGMDGSLAVHSSVRFPFPYSAWWSADVDRDGEEELIGLSPEGDTLAIAHRGPPLQGWTGVRFPLEVRPQRVTAADIDNDGRLDLLLSGKNMAGVQVFRGNNKGDFTPGPVLFPEISAADLAVADLNGDGIADVLLANWLANQIAVFFGISREVFSEQLTIDLEAEPSGLALGPVNRKRMFSVAVILPAPKKIVVFTGNGAGEFAPSDSVDLPGTVTAARFLQLNADGWPDILATGKRQLYTITANSARTFDAPIGYGVGDATGLWLLADVDGDRLADLVCCDRLERRALVAGRSQSRSRFAWPARYLSGSRPSGIIATDVNRDGWPDLCVANSGSASLSVYPNLGDGTFGLPFSVGLAEDPGGLSGVDGDPQKIICTHQAPSLLTVVDFAGGIPDGGFTIPTASNPRLLHAFRKGKNDPLRLLVRARGNSQQSVSFSVFERLSGKQFLEKTFQASLPTALRALTNGAVAGKGAVDLVLATHSRARGRTGVSYAAAGEDFSYRRVVPLVDLRDTVDLVQGLICRDLDKDGIEDLLVIPGPGRTGVGVVWARARGVFDPEISWIEGLSPQDDRTCTIADLDGDGLTDIAVLDRVSGSVRVAFGAGKRSFGEATSMAHSEGARAYTIASLRDRATLDLVVTSEEGGTVSVMYGAFAR